MTSLITEDVRDFSFSNHFKYIVQQLYKTILILDKFFLKYEGNVGGGGKLTRKKRKNHPGKGQPYYG